MPSPLTSTKPLKLLVNNIHKRYGTHEVLRGVSLSVQAGDVISIIGSSGSGKSTLLRCINLLESPNQGRITIAGENLMLMAAPNGELQPRMPQQLQRLRTKLAMVFQHINLWSHKTVLQNIIEVPIHVLGIPRHQAIETARHCLEQMDLDSIEDCYPSDLNPGKQQCVAIARALAVDPEVLLFDHPTRSLDPDSAAEVLYVMKNLAQQGRTMLVVTHELGFARESCNHLIFLHRGMIEEEGHPAHILSNPQSERLLQFLRGNLK
jgi:arginine/ornithine transport system ATP-binding protein